MSERTKGRSATPCPATAEGPFLGTDAATLRCGDIAGHDGPHYFHVEWGDTAQPRWVDTMPSRCGHTDDPTHDGRWCAICNPALGGDRGASA